MASSATLFLFLRRPDTQSRGRVSHAYSICMRVKVHNRDAFTSVQRQVAGCTCKSKGVEKLGHVPRSNTPESNF